MKIPKKGTGYAILVVAIMGIAGYAWFTSAPDKKAITSEIAPAAPESWTEQDEAEWKTAAQSGLVVRTADDSHSVWVDDGKWKALGIDSKKRLIVLGALYFKQKDFTRQVTFRREGDNFVLGEMFGAEIVLEGQ